ncbi:response regulator [Sphingomonas sp.]|uniref:response regulator n=1 Tax=Sphingomonas sp. TaxID=28214 RepID=UPI0028A061EC|nr:response regulator [Sphingomonas sp.]
MPLHHRHILVVEDEYMLAYDVQADLEAAGAVVIGPEPSVPQALLRIAREARIDAAVLDVDLRGEMAFPVADALVVRHIPFLFASGYDHRMIGDRYPGIDLCHKPFSKRVLLDLLTRLVQDAPPRRG